MDTQKITIETIRLKKKRAEKITMLTAYDYPLALVVDEVGIDIILVGDSLANVVLGLNSTTEVGMNEMIHHAKAVGRAVKRALIVGDMPYESYQKNVNLALKNAKRFIEEAKCEAIKLEWFDKCLKVTEKIVKAKIPVMGHIGLTPQTAEQLGGFKVQGKDAASAKKIIENAKALEAVGCFSIVLECVPREIAKIITEKISIPTIGIGAGVDCDGQVLVTHDILGLFDRFKPKFVKQYINLKDAIKDGIKLYKNQVEYKIFPDDAHSYAINEDELKKLKERLK